MIISDFEHIFMNFIRKKMLGVVFSVIGTVIVVGVGDIKQEGTSGDLGLEI